ncbi:putative pterin-binding protein [Rhodovarius lipocyclicus]|uniref:molybdopterin-dependent oxidoreductase n=1 Tax=Rhodovarius lipocyclicus TaxID=268410 RepID=UPI0013580B55|nr:molybdopterin-dependent oxidoreductase [Rhodovarius lipocyclicus]
MSPSTTSPGSIPPEQAAQRRALIAFGALFGAAAPALAAPGQADAMLAIQGRRPPSLLTLDRAVLDAAERETLVTHTPWTSGERRFEGLPLRRLLPDAALRAPALEAEALDGYRIGLPLADVLRNGLFLAWRHEGQLMPVRAKGPFWLLYPWSGRPELDIPLYHRRSIWQLGLVEFG